MRLSYDRYKKWLKELVESPSPFGLSDFVMTGFFRIVTNRRIFSEPTPRSVAVRFIESMLDQPNCAYLAAQAVDHGCELVTTDTDFARFPGLRWSHPLAAR